jgi:hypothetical protein
MTSMHVAPKQTNAFYAQAALSFASSLFGVLIGIAYLPVDGWVRGFLALGLLYVVTSTFTLSKCVRDQHEATQVLSRVDEARLERFLTEHDPFATATQ